jgi:O-acetyl-ADP-ribose deacetylase (regulator of RNase III)
MIEYLEDDLIEVGLRGGVDIIVHQANLEHTFGAGIARQIRLRLPYAYRADLRSPFNDPIKLGTYTIGVPDASIGEFGPVVVNLYSQTSLYPSHTSYDAMYDGLYDLRRFLEASRTFQSVGFPYQMGSGLADGKWEIVEAIIKAAFAGSSIKVKIVKLPEPKSDPLTDMFVDVGIDAFHTM